MAQRTFAKLPEVDKSLFTVRPTQIAKAIRGHIGPANGNPNRAYRGKLSVTIGTVTQKSSTPSTIDLGQRLNREFNTGT